LCALLGAGELDPLGCDTGEEQGLVDGDAESDGVRLAVGGLL
jgi:hypothetical protein